MKQNVIAILIASAALVAAVDANAQVKKSGTAIPAPTATQQPPAPKKPPPPPPPVKCSPKERSGFASIAAADGDKKSACTEARKDLETKPKLQCDPGCIGVSKQIITHGFQNGFMDGLMNEMLNFLTDDECRVTEKLTCVRK